MKKILLLALACGLTFSACNQKTSKETATTADTTAAPLAQTEINNISEVITRFVRAYDSQDNAKANALIHPELGITIIYRPGASDRFVHVDSLDFQKSIPEYYPYSKVENSYALTFGSLPTYDCGTEKWSKEGLICDTTASQQTSILTSIAQFEAEFDAVALDDKRKTIISNAEENSYRVILTTSNPLVFHVKQYQGAWYVTLLDRAYAGCDA